MEEYKPDIPMEVRIAYMQRDIDVLKIQMSEFKLFAEKASSLFHTISLLQHQLEGFDTRLDEKLELFSMRLENKLNGELRDMIEEESDRSARIESVNKNAAISTPAPQAAPKVSKDLVLVAVYILVILAGLLNIKLPIPGG